MLLGDPFRVDGLRSDDHPQSNRKPAVCSHDWGLLSRFAAGHPFRVNADHVAAVGINN